MELIQREYLIHCAKWLAFYFSSFFFYFPHLVHPLILAGSKSSGRKGQPQFLDGSAGAGPGQGEAMRNLYFAHIRRAGCLGPCVSPPAVCISSFFTEFVLEGVYIFRGSAALVDWALLSLAPPLKKIAEKAVCATPKRATLKKKSAPPEKRCTMSFCHQNKPALRPKCHFESILIRVGA